MVSWTLPDGAESKKDSAGWVTLLSGRTRFRGYVEVFYSSEWM